MTRMLMALVVAGALLAGCSAMERKVPASPTRAEVVAFVEKAAAYAQEHGKDKALAEFQKRDGQFCKGNLYIYAYSMTGVCLAHPILPERVGKDFSKDTDTHGIPIHEECVRALAKAGTGWVKCTWINPQTKKREPKLLYVRKMSPDWYLGSGTYGAAAEK